MKIKTIVTDVGGVLVRTIDYSRRHVWETKLQLKPGQLSKEIYKVEPADLATIGKIKDKAIWNDIKKRFSLSEADLVQLKLDFYAGDRLNTKFYTYLQHLHRDYTIAILSNAWLSGREIYSEKYHLDKIVDQMILSAEEGLIKPYKKIFQLTILRLEVKPEEILFIDDSLENIKAAKAVGMHTIHFQSTDETITKMKKLLN